MSSDNVSKACVPKVLVLLATYNGAQWIERQVMSVLQQERVAITIVASDDGSSDGTLAALDALAAADPRITMLARAPRSGSAGANFFRLIRDCNVADASYVAFCDQDDEWQHDKLRRACSRLRAAAACGYSSSVEAVWPGGRRATMTQSSAHSDGDYLFEGAGQGCTYVITAEMFTVIRNQLNANADLLPRLHYHDWPIYALARSLNCKWCFDPAVSMTYHQHAGNDTGARLSLAAVKRRLLLISNGWYRQQVNAVVDLVLRVQPENTAAQQWRSLSASDRLASRFQRIIFVLKHGRRRLSDRCIQATATLMGYL